MITIFELLYWKGKSMENRWHVEKGIPYPLGVSETENGFNFSMVCNPVLDCCLILYPKSGDCEISIDLMNGYRTGSVFSVHIIGLDPEAFEYNYLVDGIIYPDPYGKKFKGMEQYGQLTNEIRTLILKDKDYGIKELSSYIPYEESIFYLLHPRGFTKHSSSHVKSKGTFYGISEKIQYLKELGITSVVLMPAYEFEETERKHMMETPVYLKESPNLKSMIQETRINYWGYKKGYYFAPKSSYAYDEENAELEFSNMVSALHAEKIEVIMQFYFPKDTKYNFIIDVLRTWITIYKIDGFMVFGEKIPYELLIQEPLLKRTKLIFNELPDTIEKPTKLIDRNLCVIKDDYMYTARKLLKGDEDIIPGFLELFRKNPSEYARVKNITNYYGFTLYDLVSYDQKHNDENGEDNRDGNSYNYSWNCGFEGSTRKQTVNKLRVRQMKNAMMMVLLAQGTPMIVSGDEFANSQNGNNNPYCQDNSTTWLNWDDIKKNKELLEFTKSLISLRKSHPILRRPQEFRIMDTLSCGYPDLSFHGEEVWQPELETHSRQIAMMFCGYYAGTNREHDEFFYLAINMHWISHSFALPRLPDGDEWMLLLSTDKEEMIEETKKELKEEQNLIRVNARSIHLYCSSKRQHTKRTNKGIKTKIVTDSNK